MKTPKSRIKETMSSHGWIEKRLEEGCVHPLQHAITEDSWFKSGEGFRFNEVQVFRCKDGGNQVCAICQVNLVFGLREQNRTVFEPKDLPVRVRPIHVIACCRIDGSILLRTLSKNQGVNDFKVNGQCSIVFAFCLPRI